MQSAKHGVEIVYCQILLVCALCGAPCLLYAYDVACMVCGVPYFIYALCVACMVGGVASERYWHSSHGVRCA
jgi:hypothetical protein